MIFNKSIAQVRFIKMLGKPLNEREIECLANFAVNGKNVSTEVNDLGLKRKSLIDLFVKYCLWIPPEEYIADVFPNVYIAQIKAREGGGLNGSYQFSRLMELSLLVERYQPSTYLELGSGASSCLVSVILGQASAFTTVEESKDWHAKFLQYAYPFEHLMTSICADRIIGEQREFLSCYYGIDHDKYFDMIYVDGPYTKVHDCDKGKTFLNYGHMIDLDVQLFWENGVFPRVIIIDGRKPTVLKLIEAGKKHYDIYLSSTLRSIFLNQEADHFIYHTLLIRKE